MSRFLSPFRPREALKVPSINVLGAAGFTYPVLHNFQAYIGQEFDELGVKLIISVPWTARQLCGGL